MDNIQRQLLNKYVDLVCRRKWVIIILLMVSLPIGLGIYLFTPKVYQAASLLSYQQQKINPNKLSPDVDEKIRDIVSTLTQIVTSRTNLEKLILDLNLYPGARQKLPMEDVVDSMRKAIEIEPSIQGDIFKISFNHGNPDLAAKVTNSLAARFIEENLKYREERATETSAYTNDELLMAKDTMDRKENIMRDYKLQHYSEMPDQQDANVSRLIALQAQYQSNQESIQELERTGVLIQDQIKDRKQVIEVERKERNILGQTDKRAADEPLSAEMQLERMKMMLEQLLSRYTEMHPDVRRTRAVIAKLEREVGRNGKKRKTADGRILSDSNVDPVVLQHETQYKNVMLNIESLKAEKEDLKKSIERYEQSIAAAPVREAEWSALTREYGQLKRHYDDLVSQDLEAKSMLNLERRQKGSQFKIEDPARYPEKPIRPDFVVIMGITALAGLGLGLGLIFTLDYFDGSFRDPDTLEATLGIPLIATIPRIETVAERRQRKVRKFFRLSSFSVCLVVVVALFGLVWSKGLIVI